LFTSAVDDRELADGTPIERQGYGYWYGYIATDSRKPIQLQLNWTQGRAWPRFERTNQVEFFFVLRPLPQLDGSLDLSYNENYGTIRKIRTAGPQPGQGDRKSTRLNSSHVAISYAVFCLKKKIEEFLGV